MSEHDLNLITDLVSGRLSPGERDEALRHISSDPALQAEYETQLATASLLSDLPAPAMTADERSTLHAALRQQLHLDDALAPVVAPAPSRWQRWWAPVAGLAAAAAVIVGAVVILPNSGSDDSFEVASAALTDTTVASRNADPSVVGEDESDGSFAAEDTETPQSGAAAETTTTAAASEETTTTAGAGAEGLTGEAPTDALPHLPDGDLSSIALAYANDPETFASGFDLSTKDGSPDTARGVDVCVAEASSNDDASVFVPVATITVDGADAVVLVVTPPDAEPYFVALDVATCEELGSTLP